MKYFLSLSVSFSIFYTSLSAVEYGFLSNNTTSSITLQDGDILEVLSLASFHQNVYLRVVKIDADPTSTDNNDLLYNSSHSIINNLSSLPVFCGPSIVYTYSPSTGYRDTVFYKLTRASEVEYKNVNIVALPSSTVGKGTHEIVVEASDDLQTWTPVHSSSIGGNKAFFRTRVSLALGAEPAD